MERVARINLAENKNKWRIAINTIMNIPIPWNTEKFLTGYETTSPSMTLLHGDGSSPL
jgi:hypothetical protein